MLNKKKKAPAVVTCETREGCTLIRFPSSVFQQKETRRFEEIIESLQQKGPLKILLDLSNCVYISSEGLGITARCWKWCHDEGRGYMSVILPKETDNEVMKLFEIIGLTRMIGSAVQPSVKDAVAYLKMVS